MILEKNVRVASGDASSECFICETVLFASETVIEIEFNIPALITTLVVIRQMHAACAKNLKTLLDTRIKEASRRTS